MAEVILKDMVKIYPYVEKKPRKKLFSRKVVQQTRRGKNLQLTDKGIVAVQNFNLEIKDGEFIVLVGPSGCGKSTTLRMVAGLEEITEGELYIDGKIVNSIEPKDRDIAMVFQNYALYPHMTVYQNMAYSLKIKHVDKEEIDRKVREAAAILNITDYLERKPKNLSGGQRQRVAIGRAIVRNPKVLLMDEPLSNLDAKLRNQMRAEIIKLRQRIDTTFIYVTHDQVEAMTLGDRIVVMKDGFVQQIGTPQDVYDHPRNKFVSGFIGTPRMNYFDASLSINNGDYYVTVDKYRVRLSDDKQERLKKNKVEPQIVTLGVRPDHISVQTGVGVGVVGLVEVSELMGPSVHLHLNVSGNDVIVIVPTLGGVVDYVGKNIKIQFSGELVNLFSKENERNLEYIDEENYHVDESTSLYKSVSKADEDDLVSPLEAQNTQEPAQDTQQPVQTASVEETKEEKAL